MSKRNNTPRLLASLGCASGPNFTSGIISIVMTFLFILLFNLQKALKVVNIEIMPEVKLGPEAQPRDANNRGVLFLLDT